MRCLGRRVHAITGMLVLALLGACSAPGSEASNGNADSKPLGEPREEAVHFERGGAHHSLRLAPVKLPRVRSAPRGHPRDEKLPEGITQRLASPSQVDARILVISADGSEGILSAITQALGYQGTPYTLWIATDHPGGLTPGRLFSGSHAFFQGVILTTGDLGYYDDSSGEWRSALTSTEWAALANFEATFGLRQATWSTYPTPDYGFGPLTSADPYTDPLSAQLTGPGRQVFSYLNAASPVRFVDTSCYLATPASGSTPLLVDGSGNALALVKRWPNGRENLAFTCDGSQYHEHSLTTAYGAINWLTRGLFVGYRRVYMNPQVDDFFIADDRYYGGIYRMNAADLQRARDWQEAFRSTPVGAAFRLEFAFNGQGTEPDYWPQDTLVSATRQLQGHFRWVSHTYTHLNLDHSSRADTRDELTQNLTVAHSMGFTLFSPDALVMPDVSGLGNPNALAAEREVGIRFLISDTSVPGQDNPAPNVGIINALEPALLELPRRPTNLFYNVATPPEWTSEYNHLYHGDWGRNLSYSEILDVESDMLLAYMLRGEMDPWMFHQPNLSAYQGGHSLLSDLLDRLVAKYTARYNLPVVSPTMGDLGREMLNRTRFGSAGVSVTYGNGRVTLTARKAITVPVTGLHTADAQLYGGQYTAFIPLAAGQTVTLPLQ